ncbi:MAG TPA: hypothetical protein VN873_14010 [Candidatus Angelobacter sp.]|nr:hypothetical protein [Candidatus Angelobacter sp.]
MTKAKIGLTATIFILIVVAGLVMRHKPQPETSRRPHQRFHDVAGIPEKQPYHFTPQQSPSFSERLNFGKQLGLALRIIAKDNGGQLPPDLTPTAAWLATNTFRLPHFSDIGTTNFELIYRGNLSNLKSPDHTILAREKDPVEIHAGLWSRIYVLADGSVNRLEATTAGGFPAREKEVWHDQPQ